MMKRIATLCAALAVSAAALPAQQNIGIYISRGAFTLSGVLCGFDCADPNNTGSATAQVTDNLSFRVIGDAGTPAVLAFSIGNAAPCPGLVFPSVGNALLLDLAFPIETAAIAASVSPGGRTSCNATGGLELILPNLTIPAVAQGLTITFQAAVVDSGLFSFTRAIELTIR